MPPPEPTRTTEAPTPLDRAIAQALAACDDGAVAEWLMALAAGEGAQSESDSNEIRTSGR